MDTIDIKIKETFEEIVLKHKQQFKISKNSKPKVKGILVFQDIFETTQNAAIEMLEELILAGNKYIADKNIVDESEIEEIVKTHYNEFLKFCLFYK